MKQIAALLMGLLLLGGCAAPAPQPEPPAVAEQVLHYKVGEITRLTLLGDRLANEAGVYTYTAPTQMLTDSYLLLTWFDRAEASSRVLCGVPGCAHDTRSCPAVEPAGMIQYFLFPYDGELFCLKIARVGTGDPDANAYGMDVTLRAFSPDGAESREVEVWCSGDTASTPDGYFSVGHAFFDGRTLYLCGFMDVGGLSHYKILRFAFSGRDGQTRLELLPEVQPALDEGEGYCVEGCCSGYFLATTYRQTNTRQVTTGIRLWDPDTLTPAYTLADTFVQDEREVLTATDGEHCYLLWQNYSPNDEQDVLPPAEVEIYTLNGGELSCETFPLDAVQGDPDVSLYISNYDIAGASGGPIVLSRNTGEWLGDFGMLSSDGSVRWVPVLTCWLGDQELRVIPSACCGDDYLTVAGHLPYSNFHILQDGSPRYMPAYIPQYAFLSMEDYLAGQPNYRFVRAAQ